MIKGQVSDRQEETLPKGPGKHVQGTWGGKSGVPVGKGGKESISWKEDSSTKGTLANPPKGQGPWRKGDNNGAKIEKREIRGGRKKS